MDAWDMDNRTKTDIVRKLLPGFDVLRIESTGSGLAFAAVVRSADFTQKRSVRVSVAMGKPFIVENRPYRDW